MGINNPKDHGGPRGTTGDHGGPQKQFPCTDFGPVMESSPLTKPPGPLKATLVWGMTDTLALSFPPYEHQYSPGNEQTKK